MAKKEDGTIYFDEAEQAKVDEIVKERLARAKAEKPADYDDLKEIEKDLEEFGFSGTPAEKKAAIKAYKDQIKQQQELEKLQKEAEEEGISPTLAKKIKDLEAKLEEKTKALDEILGERQAQKTEEQKKKELESYREEQIKLATEEFGEEVINELNSNPKFIKFLKSRTTPLVESINDWFDLIGEAETNAIKSVKSKESRSTSSGKGNPDGGSTYGLTKEQQQALQEWNRKYPRMAMTAKEFKERLG